MTVTVHIGAHKTASTHLQDTLERNADLLIEAGLRFLGPRALRDESIGLCAGANRPPPNPGAKKDAIFGGASHVFLSEENILGTAHHPEMMRQGRFYPRGPKRLGHVLAAAGIDEADLLLAVRDPAPFFVSAYSQRLFSGAVVTFDAFLEGRDVTTFLWSDLVSRLAMMPQVRTITVWPFESYREVRRDVLAVPLAAQFADRIVWTDGVVHPGLSARAHDLIFERVAAGIAPSGRGHARDARKVYPKTREEPGYQPWRAAALAKSAAAYADDLDRIARIPKTTLLRGSATA